MSILNKKNLFVVRECARFLMCKKKKDQEKLKKMQKKESIGHRYGCGLVRLKVWKWSMRVCVCSCVCACQLCWGQMVTQWSCSPLPPPRYAPSWAPTSYSCNLSNNLTCLSPPPPRPPPLPPPAHLSSTSIPSLHLWNSLTLSPHHPPSSLPLYSRSYVSAATFFAEEDFFVIVILSPLLTWHVGLERRTGICGGEKNKETQRDWQLWPPNTSECSSEYIPVFDLELLVRLWLFGIIFLGLAPHARSKVTTL